MLALNNGSFSLLISTAYTCLLHLKALPMRSLYSLLRQLGLIFVLNSNLFEALELLSLNALDLKSLVLETLSHFAAFFQVVQAFLFN